MIEVYTPEYFMKQAYLQAEMALEQNEVPVGAIIVANATKTIIARAHNYTEKLHDVTAHAEMQAITAAAEYLGAKYLKDCTLYVTLEPCVMCAGALAWSQISHIVYGAHDPKRGAGRLAEHVYHPKTIIQGGVYEAPCRAILQKFFQDKR
ncbi:MAG: nucleoside deaminase [Putridiphycobacter sp.]|jgi:tRNA(adenine34) deaminase|nr:nucleoside deaminase [Putridiphycobacter sp.]